MRKRVKIEIVAILVIISVSVLSSIPAFIREHEVYEKQKEEMKDDWELSKPQELGMKISTLQKADEYLKSTDATSFIVVKDGKIVYESYYRGLSKYDLCNVKELENVIEIMLIGIAENKKKEEGGLNPGILAQASEGEIEAVFSQVLEGRKPSEYAEENLFKPLKIKMNEWQPGGELYLRPRDMAKLGCVLLEGGRWKGQQMLKTRLSVYSKEAYVLHGYGGQNICVIPKKNIVMVTTSLMEGQKPVEGDVLKTLINDYMIH